MIFKYYRLLNNVKLLAKFGRIIPYDIFRSQVNEVDNTALKPPPIYRRYVRFKFQKPVLVFYKKI